LLLPASGQGRSYCHGRIKDTTRSTAAPETVPQTRAEIGEYVPFYTSKRFHLPLDGQTPDQAYFNMLLSIPLAA